MSYELLSSRASRYALLPHRILSHEHNHHPQLLNPLLLQAPAVPHSTGSNGSGVRILMIYIDWSRQLPVNHAINSLIHNVRTRIP